MAFVLSLVAFVGIALGQASSQVVELKVDGLDRRALVFAPSKETRGAHPLVFAFHGHGGNMRNASRSFKVQDLWPEAVVVYMEGLPSAGKTDPEGVRNGWQMMGNDLGGRDLKFFDSMFEEVKKDYKVDTKRIYAMGHSNGGRFTYVLWAKRGSIFAAYGPSGSPAFGLVREMKAAPVYIIAGAADQIVPFENQKSSIETVKALYPFGSNPKVETNGYETVYRGSSGMDLATYIHPAGHVYPSEGNERLIEFFKKHAKKG